MPVKSGTKFSGFSYLVYGFGRLREDTYYDYSSYNMSSVNHSPRRGGLDNGGPFYLFKRDVKYTGDMLNDPYGYVGMISCGGPTFWTPTTRSVSIKSETDLNASGSRGFNLAAPTKPKAGLATFVGELREGLPAIVGHETWRQRAAHSRSAGSEFLNVEFGWKPLVSDIRKFAHSVKNAHSIIEGYRKDSSSLVRRRVDLGSFDETERYSGTHTTAPSSVFGLAQGETTVRLQERDWFSGAFTYHVPVSDTQMGKLQTYASNAQHLLGTNLTPEVLWNISPWTWAADWFGETGTVLSNISALGTDGLAMRWGYVMHESIRTTTSWCRRFDGIGGARTEQIKVCQRKPASPYGFGVDLSSLSGKQVAVLAALGLSKR